MGTKGKNIRAIRWAACLQAAPGKVFDLLATDAGREVFWADKSESTTEGFTLSFASGEKVECILVEATPPTRFVLSYFRESRVEITLKAADNGGTEVEVLEPACPEGEWQENRAGWVAWLFCLKAAADHGLTLRTRDAVRTWKRGFVDG